MKNERVITEITIKDDTTCKSKKEMSESTRSRLFETSEMPCFRD